MNNEQNNFFQAPDPFRNSKKKISLSVLIGGMVFFTIIASGIYFLFMLRNPSLKPAILKTCEEIYKDSGYKNCPEDRCDYHMGTGVYSESCMKKYNNPLRCLEEEGHSDPMMVCEKKKS